MHACVWPMSGQFFAEHPLSAGCPWRIPNSRAFLANIAILVVSGGARSGRPASASAGDGCPARRARRRPRCGGRIRARQAPVTDPESVAKTVAQSSFSRSRGRRSVCVLHPPGPVDPFRDCLQTIDAVEPASRADSAEVSPAVLVESIREARPQGAQPGRHCCRRRHETAEPELGVSTDRAADHTGLRRSHR